MELNLFRGNHSPLTLLIIKYNFRLFLLCQYELVLSQKGGRQYTGTDLYKNQKLFYTMIFDNSSPIVKCPHRECCFLLGRGFQLLTLRLSGT